MKQTLLPLAAVFIAIPAAAQQDTPLPERPPIHFQVLKRWKTDMGDHAIYLNRVAPPALQASPVEIPQPVVPAAQDATLQVPVPQVAVLQAPATAKKSELLFLSATVHDHRFSEIRWSDEGRACSAFSNIDFNLLGGMLAFETADTAYSLMLALRNVTTPANGANLPAGPTAGSPQPEPSQISTLDQLSRTHAQYLIAADESGALPLEKTLAALDALHLYYDANRQRLADDYAKREAARLEAAQRAKEPPKPKPDTVVNFWHGNGKVILDAKEKAAQP